MVRQIKCLDKISNSNSTLNSNATTVNSSSSNICNHPKINKKLYSQVLINVDRKIYRVPVNQLFIKITAIQML